ncbi:tail fiber domain-containing protein [Hymenobacter chitinivorans]|uniref:tail fiber domain-containing protein n=1 Tax=Hymenobacter chitinivorans TaxID=89969 RepID=UPI0012FE1618|nr:tail fiber domain-containing protein [Hymenobacter chitinivorans]
MKALLLATAAALLLAAPTALRAQSVGIGTTTPASSAVLDVTSPNPGTAPQGFLPPRLTQVQREAIQQPAAGLLVYQTDSPATGTAAGLYLYGGSSWSLLPTSGSTTGGDNLGNHTATQNLNLNGNKLVGGTTARATRGGLSLNGNGLLTVGATRVNADSTTRYGVRLLDMDQDVVITSDQGKGNTTPAVTGAGDRLMWLSYYSAFRAGGVTGDRWNTTSSNSAAIGQYSAAFGLDNQAGSTYSTAFGWNNRMRNCEGTLVTGINNDMAQSFYGVAMGGRNSPKGWYNLVGGYQCKVLSSTVANYSAAVGAYVPNWPPSLAFGQGSYSRSSRGNTYTLGYYARTNGYFGCFVLADMSPLAITPSNIPPTDRAQDSVYCNNYNQFTARFAGGYRLFTTVATRDDPAGLSPLGTPVGVQLFAGGNAWQTLSDSTKKERRVLADGNQFLARINRMRLGSWNYIGQSPDTMRHYGPMAQDFYAAFGHDGVGRSGNATTINQADFDGVNLIAIQALYRQVLALKAENDKLRQQTLKAQQNQQRTEASTASLEERLRRLEGLLAPQAQR